MGKAQYKRRIRSARHHANGVPITQEDIPNPSTPVNPEVVPKPKNKKAKSQTQQNERQATIAVLDKISSPSSHDRIWSLAAMSNLVLSSASTRQLFLSKNLIRLLINRLIEDADQEDVLVEVTGVLRNLVIEGGRDVCGEMANKGILQPLNILVSKLLASILNFQDTNGSGLQNTPAQSLIWSRLVLISENVVIILWSLASGNIFQMAGLSYRPSRYNPLVNQYLTTVRRSTQDEPVGQGGTLLLHRTHQLCVGIWSMSLCTHRRSSKIIEAIGLLR
ncbi:hypothetical protein PGTUg99_008096 [Puccinia graminis f. sp. tritici]|uniref:Wings apart-like protein C-terminal domain-containing protein n=1 Tax=Puccinia graminis f. sp. tritici TaxID=56615 RepID=A0A5B0N1S1_PUCGR|nr:hypothetical protein PGTUg99_008096 [Puccinia graminis f. sp. tritici]